MEPAVKVDNSLFKEIDKTSLNEKRICWKEAVKKAPYSVHVDRQKYATESWKQTEGEDLEIRRAKLFEHVVKNIEISILDFDYIVGRMGPTVVGAYTAIDICGDYLEDVWSDMGGIRFSMHDKSSLTHDELEVLRDAARVFGGKTIVDMGNRVMEDVLGSWPQDALEARLKDPQLTSGNFGNSTNTIDFEKILNRGLKYFIEEAQAHIDDFIASQQKGPDRIYFWKAAIIVAQACIDLSHRYASLAREMAETEPDTDRKAELLDIAEACEHVPENPARNFREALQAMSITGICKGIEHPMHNYPQWGRADLYLYPFFSRDIKRGNINMDQATNLLAELIGRWGTQMYVDSGFHKETHQITFAINSINLGGITVDGKEGSNELSYLFLHTVGLLKQSSPTVMIRWNHFTPDWLMQKAIKTNIICGGGIPLFENEEGIIDLYVKDGVPLEEARTWIGRGCVWPALPQRSEYKSGAAGFNNAAVLHMVLHNGVAITGKKLGLETGDPRTFRTFEELWDAFAAQHRFVMHRTLWLANLVRDIQAKYLRLPFLSTVSLQCCMDGGYDTMVPPPVSEFGITDRAVIDTADALIAMKKLVFDDKKITMEELLDALDTNFEGEKGAEIQKMCLEAPKFGNDIDEVDDLARKVSILSTDSVTSWDNSPYPHFISLREGLSWHYFAGQGVGALPNGRKALEPLNDGSASPMRGMDKKGPTAVLRSVIKAGFGDHSYVQALNQKFPRSMIESEDSVDKLMAYTNAFLGAGGTHIQYNLVDTVEMKEAQVKPDEHRDLIVRVGGFSAYFVQLSRQIQDDVILRSEHNL